MTKRLHAPIFIAMISVLVISCEPAYPPLLQAARQGDVAEVERLFEAGEYLNQKTTDGGQMAFHLAAAEGQDEMVLWLLAHEANFWAQDHNGQTPADVAKSHGHEQTAQIILDYDQLLRDEAQATESNDIETLRSLLSQDMRGYTVLHVMAQYGLTQQVVDEIARGADVNARTVNGFTPLHKAVVGGKIEICQLLLDAGADANVGDIYNDTPIFNAINQDNKEIVELFINAGADLSIRSSLFKASPLEYARSKGNAEIIALLEQE